MLPEFLDCKKDETIEVCPICGAEQVNDQQWPQSGTHAFTIPYECGTEIDYPIGYDGATYGVSCNGEVKRITLPKLSDFTPEQIEKIKNIFKQGK